MSEIHLLLLDEAFTFIGAQSSAVRKKIYYNIDRVLAGERDADIFKKVDGAIWEFRTIYDKKSYRLFAFWDTDAATLIVATHGIVKKSQKTPRKELARAKALRAEYFNDKEK